MTQPDQTPATPPAATGAVVVACLGSSSTAGRGQAFNWIRELEERPRNRHVSFRNFGVGGDLAYNALQRLPDVFRCEPAKVVVLIGGNDVLALVSEKVRRFFRITKHLPQDPSPEWFRDNLREIVRRVKSESGAAVALCSLPPIGEDPSSTNPFQSEINQRIQEHCAIIRDIAREEEASYIAVHEALLAQITQSPGLAMTDFQFLPLYRDAFRVLALRMSPDQIAKSNGWRFHTDGVHLNSRGGRVVADLIQEFIDA